MAEILNELNDLLYLACRAETVADRRRLAQVLRRTGTKVETKVEEGRKAEAA